MTALFEGYRAIVLHYQVIILTLILLAFVAACVFFVIGSLRLRNLRHLYQSALVRPDINALEAILLHQAEVEQGLAERVATLEEENRRFQTMAKHHLQRCVLQRYRAFKDVGGDQSFSLTLLDANGDGIILTSIYGREESRIFAKQITGGTSAHPLSEEERRVLAAAREDSGVRQKDIPAATANL